MINIDFEVRAHFALDSLLEEIDERIDLLYCGEFEPGNFLLSGELAGSGLPNSVPDTTAQALCKIIESLSVDSQFLWSAAYDRVFDVGFGIKLDLTSAQYIFSPETLTRMGKLNIRLAVSMYEI